MIDNNKINKYSIESKENINMFKTDRAAQMSKDNLTALRGTQIIIRTLLKSEEMRLSKKLGKDHPRVRQLREKLRHNLEIVKELEVRAEIAKIKVPEVTEDKALIYGRLMDENRLGIKGLTVYLMDEQEKPVYKLGKSESDASGFYSLMIDSDTIENIEKAKDKELFLVVSDKKGRIIYRKFEPLKITKGTRTLIEAVFNRKDITPIPTKEEEEEAKKQEVKKEAVKKQEEKKQEEKKEEDKVEKKEEMKKQEEKKEDEPSADSPNQYGSDAWLVKGKVVNEEDNGISGLTVSLYDKDHIFDDILGTEITDTKGNFEIIYRKEAFQDLFTKNPDLYLKVLDKEGKSLYSSKKKVKYSAGRIEEFNITIKTKKKI